MSWKVWSGFTVIIPNAKHCVPFSWNFSENDKSGLSVHSLTRFAVQAIWSFCGLPCSNMKHHEIKDPFSAPNYYFKPMNPNRRQVKFKKVTITTVRSLMLFMKIKYFILVQNLFHWTFLINHNLRIGFHIHILGRFTSRQNDISVDV